MRGNVRGRKTNGERRVCEGNMGERRGGGSEGMGRREVRMSRPKDKCVQTEGREREKGRLAGWNLGTGEGEIVNEWEERKGRGLDRRQIWKRTEADRRACVVEMWKR